MLWLLLRGTWSTFRCRRKRRRRGREWGRRRRTFWRRRGSRTTTTCGFDKPMKQIAKRSVHSGRVFITTLTILTLAITFTMIVVTVTTLLQAVLEHARQWAQHLGQINSVARENDLGPKLLDELQVGARPVQTTHKHRGLSFLLFGVIVSRRGNKGGVWSARHSAYCLVLFASCLCFTISISFSCMLSFSLFFSFFFLSF